MQLSDYYQECHPFASRSQMEPTWSMLRIQHESFYGKHSKGDWRRNRSRHRGMAFWLRTKNLARPSATCGASAFCCRHCDRQTVAYD